MLVNKIVFNSNYSSSGLFYEQNYTNSNNTLIEEMKNKILSVNINEISYKTHLDTNNIKCNKKQEIGI